MSEASHSNHSPVWNQLAALATNLASTWNGGDGILRRLVELSGENDIGPWAAMQKLGPVGVDRLFGNVQLRRELDSAFSSLTRYLTATTWFDRAATADPSLAVLENRPVAYFCTEFGLANWLPIYSGGLGVLAGDVLKEASDMGLPMIGVGLFYRQGFFHQRLDESGYQRESSTTLDPSLLPLTNPFSGDETENLIQVPLADRTIYLRAWKLQVGRTALYLLDTDVPQNERQDDREITQTLYGGDQDTRIRQEIVLGIGGVRLLRALGVQPSIYSMNEGHAAFLGVELLASQVRDADFSTAIQRVRPSVVYTNHTVVPAGNDVFPPELVRAYLGPYAESTGIGLDRLLSLAPDRSGFSMTLLAFALSGRANAVSRLHAEVIPREWPGFAVEAVTNGVHVPSWVGSRVGQVLDRYVPNWRSDDPTWTDIYSIPGPALWEAHVDQRRALVDYVNGRQESVRLDPHALTLVWARRFAEYKRAGLMTSDLARLSAIMSNPERPVQIVVAGKAHPRDEAGKQALRLLLHRVGSEAHTAPHVAFVEDYGLDVAHMLTGGADVWVNTPRKPLEASGTSGMKAGDNGALQLTVRDGWAAEVEWWDTGWGIDGQSDDVDAAQLYGYLEDDIVPTFFSRDGEIPVRWTEMMKRSMIVTLSEYSARRMLLDYVEKLYLPLLRSREPEPAQEAQAIHDG